MSVLSSGFVWNLILCPSLLLHWCSVFLATCVGADPGEEGQAKGNVAYDGLSELDTLAVLVHQLLPPVPRPVPDYSMHF